jgi:hypothetical protein
MFSPKPVIPQREDRIPHYVVLRRTSLPRWSAIGLFELLDSMRHDAYWLVDERFPGPKVVQVLRHWTELCCDRNALADLRKLIDTGQCDVVVVGNLNHLGRTPRLQLALVGALVDAGVRVISFAECFDTAVEDWQSALPAKAARGV